VAVKSPLAERGAEAVPSDEREAALLPLALTRAEGVALAGATDTVGVTVEVVDADTEPESEKEGLSVSSEEAVPPTT
jgi:hypothetical protein